jgi:alpha-N-arabinofuranosidase
VRGVIETPWGDVSAALRNDGFVSLMVVNIHESREFETEIVGVPANEAVEVHIVTGSGVRDSNEENRQSVGVTVTSWDGKGNYAFPKHSPTWLRWKQQ